MKGILSVSLLVVAVVGAGCDQQQQASSNSQPVDYFAKKRECYELATKRQARDDEASAKRNTPDAVNVRGEQCYVPTMNTCIYESGILIPTASKSIMTVEDLLTGHELANGNAVDPTYKQERDRLFALCAK